MTEEQKKEIDERYYSRLEYELSVIEKMGFAGYFLIVSDFIRWSKTHGVPVGPGARLRCRFDGCLVDSGDRTRSAET